MGELLFEGCLIWILIVLFSVRYVLPMAMWVIGAYWARSRSRLWWIMSVAGLALLCVMILTAMEKY